MAKIRLVPEGDLLDTATVAGAALAEAFGYHGTGSPIGQLDDAPVGTRYTDDAATDGAVEWVRYPDGWRVEVGDTGWIDLSPAAGSINNHPGINVRVRRTGHTVHAQVYETSTGVAGSGVTTILNLPTGWKPTGPGVVTGAVIDGVTGAVLPAAVYVTPAAVLRLSRAPSSSHSASLTWAAEASWPNI